MIYCYTTLCDTCGTCIAVCPVNALCLTKRIAVDDTRCIHCEKCINICPAGAMRKDKDIIHEH